MGDKAMTKTELVSALAEKTGSGKAIANDMLGALAEIVATEVARGGAVTVPGLGKFSCRERPARLVRNPATGEQVHKEADRVAKVTIAKALNDGINV
ncbi:MAG: HU family DNA-binding protein [Pseudomonadota bacterium]